MDSITIDIRDGVSGLDSEAWDALVGDDSPFVEHAFLATLEATGCVGEGTGWIPQIVCAWQDGGDDGHRLVGALPLYLKTHSHGEFVFDWGWADAASRAGLRYYPKAVVAVPMTPVTGRRLLVAADVGRPDALRRALVEAAVGFSDQVGLSSVHFNFVLPAERAIFEAADLPIRRGMQYHWYNGASLGQDDDYADFDDYLARFRSKTRSNIRRERRKLAESGVTTEVVTGEAIGHDHMDRMFAYYKDTVDKFYWGRQYLNRDFFHAILDAHRDRLHLVVASDADGEFAGAFNLHKGERLYGRYWGCSREVKYTHFEVCMYRPIEWCIDQGVQVFEPGAGGEHKYDRGFQPTPTYSAHHLSHPGLDEAVRDFIDRESRAVDAEIAALRDDSPYKD